MPPHYEFGGAILAYSIRWRKNQPGGPIWSRGSGPLSSTQIRSFFPMVYLFGRILLLALLVWAALRLIGRLTQKSAASQDPKDAEFEPMVACRRCKTHVPRSAVDASGLCRECRRSMAPKT